MGETTKAQRGEATYPILLSWKGQSQDSLTYRVTLVPLSAQVLAKEVLSRCQENERTQASPGLSTPSVNSSRLGEIVMPIYACIPGCNDQSDHESGAVLGMRTCHGPSLGKGTATEARVGTGPAGTVPYFPHNCHQFSLCSSSRSGSARSSKATAN